jgi:hypothetical protein
VGNLLPQHPRALNAESQPARLVHGGRRRAIRFQSKNGSLAQVGDVNAKVLRLALGFLAPDGSEELPMGRNFTRGITAWS